MGDNFISCTLCGCETTEKIDSIIRNADNDKYKMYKCTCCETHFLYPRPEVEQLEEYYDGTFREQVHSETYYEKNHMDGVFSRFFVEAVVRADRVKDEMSKTDAILEIGCSVGYFMKAISPYVGKVYGTEWDKKAAQYIKDTFPEFEVARNPQDFGVKFDRIFMFHVLEHIEKPIEFLEGLKELLNPGGVIYIEIPNADDILVKTYKCTEFMEYYYKLAHLYNFNETGMKYILDKAGLKGDIEFIQRYDLSNHLVWLGEGVPKGKGRYIDILDDKVNDAYVDALKKAKQTDTLFARIAI